MMTDDNMIEPIGKDPLNKRIEAEKAADPAPRLSGMAKAAIVEAAIAEASTANRQAAQSATPFREALAALTERLSGGLEVLLRPVAVGTLGFAGIAGLAAGGMLAAPAYAELTPEQELAAHYEYALTASGGIYDDQDTDGAF